MDLNHSSRILSEFCYYAPVKKLANEVELESTSAATTDQSENTDEEFIKAVANFELEEVSDYFELFPFNQANLENRDIDTFRN